MKSKKIASLICMVALCITTLPVQAASTRDEVKALREEVAELKAGQDTMQSELAEIKKLLEAGNRPSAPTAAAFKPRDFELGDVAFKGAPGAAVTVVEFSDYQCPYCKRHATSVFPQLLEQYGDQVRFTMREFPIENLHPRAFSASRAALCAGEQDAYWAMHDRMFADQRALDDAGLKASAAAIGLDQAAFDACYDSDRYTDLIREHQREAGSMGISGTPSFVIGLTDADDPNLVHLSKFIRGAQPLTAFQAAIDDLLEEAADSD